MDTLKVRNFGPIENANVEFGDLTFLIGPQASGKSIFLQLLKLIEDKHSIANILYSYGYVWKNTSELLQLFFGEGMQDIWNKNTKVEYNSNVISAEDFKLGAFTSNSFEKIVYIPAQRVLTLQNGWPKPFSDYGNDPFVLKSFSDLIRQFMEKGPGPALFHDITQKPLRDSMYRSIFYDGELELDTSSFRKRFILNINNSRLPYMMWSTGQKEFMPLWLGIYFVLHPAFTATADKRTIIIEEPEMGLHPKALKGLILEMLELISVGYKVIVSTHSAMFLEFAWALQILKDNNTKPEALCELFEIDKSDRWDKVFPLVMTSKKLKTYYFDKKEQGGSCTKDISSLDVDSHEIEISEWGGLSHFATRASEIVSKNVNLNEQSI